MQGSRHMYRATAGDTARYRWTMGNCWKTESHTGRHMQEDMRRHMQIDNGQVLRRTQRNTGRHKATAGDAQRHGQACQVILLHQVIWKLYDRVLLRVLRICGSFHVRSTRKIDACSRFLSNFVHTQYMSKYKTTTSFRCSSHMASM